jgi:hypothetical protein
MTDDKKASQWVMQWVWVSGIFFVLVVGVICLKFNGRVRLLRYILLWLSNYEGKRSIISEGSWLGVVKH